MMEKCNLNFSDSHNTLTSMCWILSVISWILLIITNLICYRWIKNVGTVWTIYKIPIVDWFHSGFKTADNSMGTYPIQMQETFIYIVFTILLIFIIVAFIIFMLKSTCKKDISFFDEMFNQYSKFHFIPLLCGTALFLIAETIDGERKDQQRNIAGLIIVIIGLASLIFIYIKINLPGEWMYAVIKKGAFSCLIALEWYYFCYDIINIRINNESENKHVNTINICGIIFSIIIGLGSLIFSFFFKDVVIPFIHFIIYIGMAIFFFSIDSKFREIFNYIQNVEGIIDIIMAVLLLAEIVFLIYKNQKECLK